MGIACMAMMHTNLNMLVGNFLPTSTKQAPKKCIVFVTDVTNTYNAKPSSILYRAGVSPLQMANTHLFLFFLARALKKCSKHTKLGASISSGTKNRRSSCGNNSKKCGCITLVPALQFQSKFVAKLFASILPWLLGRRSVRGGIHTHTN